MRFWELALIAVAILICQAGVFYFQAWRCEQKLPKMLDDEFTALVVTDVHLLGKRRRSVIERMWVDWQIRAAIRAAVDVHAPDVVVVLGDQFDEGGRRTSDSDWDEYAQRFLRVFASFLPKKTLYVVGNHDTSFGREMNLHDLKRFEVTFGATNHFDVIEGHTFVVLNTMALDSDVASHDVRTDAMTFFNSIKLSDLRMRGHKKVILLSHLPLFRENDLQCGEERLREVGHVTYEAPEFEYTTHHHVLSRELSVELLVKVQPDLVLSGHTHAWCACKHPDSKVMEYTVPAFSWGQRPDPSYALLRLSQTQESIITACNLPREPLIFAAYGATVSILVLAHVVRFVRRRQAQKTKTTKGV
ncbi:metallophosphoesterase 1 [Plasmopara halstedii]|uniref:Metallophosphoesterase 1 n=1 Tax=Plasmopara halstedii TaxID=4781 RepID=A0A0P1ATK2_PLAHL|nr:metallophosphoesterase 1 [Plasmopara halstedii]CEG45638.1 metallophosphoesterase 1 [Plasmopara halstedii]|eukprot:XP_024582007.1 metallophosphoesterase 1 [Plasmopara halstedii]